MKKFKLSIFDIVVLIIFVTSITLDVFWNFLTSFFDIVLLSNYFSNPYTFTKFLTSNAMVISNIGWLNKILFLIAGILPSIILYVALKNIDSPNWLNVILSIALYYLVLQLFLSVFFWILCSTCILAFIVCKLISRFKHKKDKNEEEIQ